MRLDVYNIILRELYRKIDRKTFLAIFQIAISIFILIPGLNFLTFYDVVDNKLDSISSHEVYSISNFTLDYESSIFSLNEVEQLYNHPSIKDVLKLYSSFQFKDTESKLYDSFKEIFPGEIFKNIRFNYSDYNYADFFKRDFISGTFYTKKNQIVISNNVANLLFDTSNCIGEIIELGGLGHFEVAGVIGNGLDLYSNKDHLLIFYFPFDAFIKTPNCSSVLFRSNNKTIINKVLKIGDREDKIYKLKKYYAAFQKSFIEIHDVSIIVISFSLLLLIVSFLGNIGISLSLFLKTLRISGIKISIGCPESILIIQIFFENIFLYFTGTILGIIFSYLFKFFLNSLDPIYNSMEYRVSILVITIIFSLVLVISLTLITLSKMKQYNLLSLLKQDFGA